MDTQIKECAKNYAKEKAFGRRLLVNIIGIIVIITMSVSYAIAQTRQEPVESTSVGGESLDSSCVSNYVRENAGDNDIDVGGDEMEPGSNEVNTDIYETDSDGNEIDIDSNGGASDDGEVNGGDYEMGLDSNGADASSYETDIESYETDIESYDTSADGYEENIGGYDESMGSNDEDMENYRDSVEDFLRYSYEDDVDDLLQCAGTYTHVKIPDITLDISIYSEPDGKEVGSFKISDTESIYSGVIKIGDQIGKYKVKLEDGNQHTIVFYTDGIDYYIYIHSMQYIYGRAESGLFVLTEK